MVPPESYATSSGIWICCEKGCGLWAVGCGGWGVGGGGQ